MIAVFFASACAVLAATDVLPLDGSWEITEGDPGKRDAAWRPITVPDAFESALGDDFDGVATYRRDLVVPNSLRGDRFFVEFDAVATSAHVFWNGSLVGEHLGGWTPFRCEVTKYLRKGHPNTVTVVVDEKVGHDTQGFLPIVQPHFGGIWQSVRLVAEHAPCFDESRVLTFGDFARRVLIVEAPLSGEQKDERIELELDLGDRKLTREIENERVEIAVGEVEPWNPGSPRLFPLTLRLVDRNGAIVDSIERRVGFRTLATDGRRLLLNGAPLNVRGVLEWGYYPPLRAPNRGLEEFERQIHEAKARGFNLIKFCLWVPPKRLLDAMDRLGMLAWMEYPTWHPSFAESTRAALFAEFDEFFRHDRSHPSVIVRSLTCETGPSAPLEVMKSLYDRAHAAIPNAFVEDDSSWISWNRVHDFYDDHPYGNNATWPATLARLELFISDRKPMPLLLGEAIAADTWLDRDTVRAAPARFRPIAFDALEAWEGRFADRFGAGLVPRLTSDSLRYCLAQRKDQIEAFRQLQPHGGYVVSVARDFRLASMGLADAFDRWKWRTDEFAWHGDTMLLLGSGSPRALAGGVRTELPVWIAHHGASPLPASKVRWRLGDEAAGAFDAPALAPGDCREVGTIAIDAPDVYGAYALTLEVTHGEGLAQIANAWPCFVVPTSELSFSVHDHDHDHGAGEVGNEEPHEAEEDAAEPAPFVEALTPELLDEIRDGRNVLLLATARPGSFLAENRWTLRGTVWMPDHPLIEDLGRSFFTELCVKDLHPVGMIPLGRLFDHVEPIVGFVDSHDVPITTDYGLLFETRIGNGRLVVSALPLAGNAAADFLRERLLEHLEEESSSARALPDDLVDSMRAKMTANTLDLTDREWRFRAEPEGGEPGEWSPIRVGASWEGQGHPTLDGLARYRLEIELPPEFLGRPLYLNVDGADDAYWVHYDGAERGSGGDVANRKTAFATKATHRLADHATAGAHVLEIVVLDWYGAGGLHRPLSLSTAPLSEEVDFLRGR